MSDQLAPFLCIESVGVCHQPQPNRSISHLETQSGRAQVIIDGDAHSRQGGEVKDRTAGSCEVEVEKADRLSLSEDHILQAHIVVTDHGPTAGIGQLVTPSLSPNGNSGGCFVERPDQRGDGPQGFIGLRPCRKWGQGNIAFDEGQPLTAIALYLHWHGGTLEPGEAEVSEEVVYGARMRVRWPKYELAPTNNSPGIGHSARQDLVHPTSLSGTTTRSPLGHG
jgi:hypothetical protein